VRTACISSRGGLFAEAGATWRYSSVGCGNGGSKKLINQKSKDLQKQALANLLAT